MANSESNPIIQKAKQILINELPDVISIYVFGSYASGHDNKDSDLDLAFQATSPLSDLARFELQQTLERGIGIDVDLIDLIKAPTVVALQATYYGQLIYCADSYQCESLATLIFCKYIRFNELRQSIIDDAKKRGQIL